jgi:hypothetical protein
MTRITRTIDGFTLFTPMAAPVPVSVMAIIVARGIVGAGAEREAEKKENQLPWPEVAWLASAVYSAD